MSKIDRTFNPIQQALHDRHAASHVGDLPRLRMCWNCMKDKPMRGGTYPHHNQGKRCARWRCADCTKLKEQS